ncbi:helix-turn-helix domain-containing protein [Spirosoma arcticum]
MYQVAPAPKHLKEYIDCFWMGEQQSNPYRCLSHHAVASTKLELQFHYVGQYATLTPSGRNEQIFKAGFFGQTNTYKHYFSLSQKTGIFSIRFRPLALITLFNITASELTNECADIQSVLDRSGVELAEQIFEEDTFAGCVNRATQFIEAKLKNVSLKYSSIGKILTHIDQSDHLISVNDLVTQACLSPRQFERNFKDVTGFSAKAYLKIVRFEQLLETVSNSQPASNKLTDVALELGYYDQAHLNRHFNAFTGISPTAYFSNLDFQNA